MPGLARLGRRGHGRVPRVAHQGRHVLHLRRGPGRQHRLRHAASPASERLPGGRCSGGDQARPRLHSPLPGSRRRRRLRRYVREQRRRDARRQSRNSLHRGARRVQRRQRDHCTTGARLCQAVLLREGRCHSFQIPLFSRVARVLLPVQWPAHCTVFQLHSRGVYHLPSGLAGPRDGSAAGRFPVRLPVRFRQLRDRMPDVQPVSVQTGRVPPPRGDMGRRQGRLRVDLSGRLSAPAQRHWLRATAASGAAPACSSAPSRGALERGRTQRKRRSVSRCRRLRVRGGIRCARQPRRTGPAALCQGAPVPSRSNARGGKPHLGGNGDRRGVDPRRVPVCLEPGNGRRAPDNNRARVRSAGRERGHSGRNGHAGRRRWRQRHPGANDSGGLGQRVHRPLLVHAEGLRGRHRPCGGQRRRLGQRHPRAEPDQRERSRG
mmetsp:Transcript_2986/g.12209  ORF Transcript_2986/g.12209 Transcript_2986/m.12209 type:complete len:434 (+) Transcript_2986:1779-3080(+)